MSRPRSNIMLGLWLALSTCGMGEAGELRDPFVFGAVEHRIEVGTNPALTGILWDAKSPLAMFNGEPVVLGQTVAGWQVVEIHPDSVVIQRGQRRETLVSGSSMPSD